MRILFLSVILLATLFVNAQDWTKLDSAGFIKAVAASSAKLDTKRPVKKINNYLADPAINGDSLYRLLTRWNEYPRLSKTGIIGEFYVSLDTNYKAPVLVYVPKNYNPAYKTSVLVYFKGGWLSRKQAPVDYAREIVKDNPTFTYLNQQNVIEIFPVLDSKLAIYGYYGYKHLYRIVTETKRLFNVDDNKVYLSGFSDGGKTVYNALGYASTPFACFYAINGMFVSPPEYYNMVNRPVVSFVAEKDQLTDSRSIQSKAAFVTKLGGDWNYRLMVGKKHFYHPYQSEILPWMFTHMQTKTRNPFPARLAYVSMDNYEDFHGIDWLQIKTDTKKKPEAWHRIDSIETFGNDGAERNYRYGNNKGQAKAEYFDNTFTLSTSQVTEVTIYISPMMVDLSRPVHVVVNGKELFTGRVDYSKEFMAERFLQFFDRQQVWVNKITVAVE